MRHNKKRNAAIIYEQLVRFISKSLVEGKTERAKEAMAIVQEHFKPGTHLHKEFKLFNALVRATVPTDSIAIRILDEAKRAAREHDTSALDREKGLLIRSINKRLNYQNFFEQRIPDYRSLATVQTLLNDWRAGTDADLTRVAEYETKVITMLTEKKNIPALEVNGKVSNLSVNIMKKKVGEKMANELTSEQLRIIKLSLVEDKNSLIPILAETKADALSNVKSFEKSNKNQILSERVGEVRKMIESLSPEDTGEENVSKFLVLTKLVEELRGSENV